MSNKKITLEALAAQAGVSKATVSRVLNGNTYVSDDIKNKVQLAIAETGYKSKGKSLQFGVAVQKVTIISGDFLGNGHGFYHAILAGIKKEAQRLSLELEIYLVKPTTSREQLNKKIQQSHAILLIGLDSAELLSTIHQHNVPCVIINGHDPQMNISSISPDYTLGGQLAVNALIEQGHRKIKLVTSQHRYSLRQRTDGYRHALQTHGIALNPEQDILDLAQYAQHTLDDQALAERIITGQAGMDFGASELLEHAVANGEFDGYSAVFCVCDMVAYALLDALSQQEIRVPEEVSIIGFDNLEMSTMTTPPLTTVSTNFSELAKSALHMLIKEINQNDDFTSRLCVGVKLVARDSTAPFTG